MTKDTKAKPMDPDDIDPMDPDQAPPWGPREFARARPGREVFAEIFGPAAAAELQRQSDARRGGRPKAAAPKTKVALRIAPDVLDYYRATGPGWHTRMEAALRAGMK